MNDLVERIQRSTYVDRDMDAVRRLVPEIIRDLKSKGIEHRLEHGKDGYQGGVMFSRKEITRSTHPMDLIDARLRYFRDMMVDGMIEAGWLEAER